MRKAALLATILVASASGYFIFFHGPSSSGSFTSREEYEAFLNNHPYKRIIHGEGIEKKDRAEGEEGEGKGDNPDRAMMQNFLMTMDPSIRRPTPEVLEVQSLKTAVIRDAEKFRMEAEATSLSTGTVWAERGPKSVGGRTRALMFDPNDPNKKKVWAGGVAGGLWFNPDITLPTSAWQKVDDFWDNMAVSCIAADPVNSQIFYVGTGEGWFNSDVVVGAGIWKTTNGGTTWAKLPSTVGYSFVNDIIVRNESGVGVVYAAVRSGTTGTGFTAVNNGVFRSADGGAIWAQVLPTSINQKAPTDLEISKDNAKIFVGATPRFTGGVASIYTSTVGTTNTWTEVTFTGNEGRVEIACAPSNQQVAYAVIEHNNKIGTMAKTTNGGTSWTAMNLPVDADLGIPSTDFSRSQAWYDLIMAAHPTDENTVIVGAIDLFASSNGGTSWTQISKWSNNPNLNTLSCALVHADQHALAFRPGFPNEMIVGNDGGVYYSSNIIGAASNPAAFSARNLNYNVTQFYSAAIHPTQTNIMVGGTQDNGTEKFTLPGMDNTTGVMGGDGGMCFIDQVSPQFVIASTTNNNFRLSTDGGNTFSTTLIDDDATGNFINQGEYDSNLKILYTGKSSTEIYRVLNVTTTRTLESVAIALGSDASTFRVSPHATSSSNLYIGTEAGKLFKVVNAHTVPFSPANITNITGPSFPIGSISSIAFGATESQILVTFSNYGVVSIWETRNGGTTWVNREGDLPNMPVRWAEYHPHNFDQVYLATELGVWTTDNINVASPDWSSANGGLANVRTDMVRLRKSDGMIMAATHGRGVFTAIVPSQLSQVITFSTIPATKTFGDATFKISAKSTSGLPIAFSSSNTSVVTIADSTVTIAGAGTVQISANQSGNAFFAPATAVTQTLTVNKAAQTITFATLPEKDVDDPDFTISATASSGLPVSFTSSNSSIAAIAGNTLVINAPGTAIITAAQAGNTNFLPAPNQTQNFAVLTRIMSVPSTLDFGEGFIGESPKKVFTIQNTGTGSLSVTGITYPSAYTGESKTVGSNIEVTVTFTPTSVTTYTGEIIILSNATSGNSRIAVTGSGILITAAEQNEKSGTEVYPNPVGDLLLVKTAGEPPASVVIIDMAGREQKFNRISLREKVAEFDVSKLSKGAYILRVPQKNGYFTSQINKQ
jgi:hypothetical protein